MSDSDISIVLREDSGMILAPRDNGKL